MGKVAQAAASSGGDPDLSALSYVAKRRGRLSLGAPGVAIPGRGGGPGRPGDLTPGRGRAPGQGASTPSRSEMDASISRGRRASAGSVSAAQSQSGGMGVPGRGSLGGTSLVRSGTSRATGSGARCPCESRSLRGGSSSARSSVTRQTLGSRNPLTGRLALGAVALGNSLGRAISGDISRMLFGGSVGSSQRSSGSCLSSRTETCQCDGRTDVDVEDEEEPLTPKMKPGYFVPEASDDGLAGDSSVPSRALGLKVMPRRLSDDGGWATGEASWSPLEMPAFCCEGVNGVSSSSSPQLRRLPPTSWLTESSAVQENRRRSKTPPISPSSSQVDMDVLLSRKIHGNTPGVRLAKLDLSAGAIVGEFDLQSAFSKRASATSVGGSEGGYPLAPTGVKLAGSGGGGGTGSVPFGGAASPQVPCFSNRGDGGTGGSTGDCSGCTCGSTHSLHQESKPGFISAAMHVEELDRSISMASTAAMHTEALLDRSLSRPGRASSFGLACGRTTSPTSSLRAKKLRLAQPRGPSASRGRGCCSGVCCSCSEAVTRVPPGTVKDAVSKINLGAAGEGIGKGPHRPEASGGKGKGKGLGPTSASSSPTAPPPKAPVKGGPPGKGPSKGAGKGAAPGKTAPGSKAPEPRKPEVKPKTPVKKLYWSAFRIGPDAESNTVWSAIDKEGIRIDSRRLEALFADESSRSLAAQAEQGRRAAQVQKIQVLSNQRRQQVCVMLARLPTPRETCLAISQMDVARLSHQQVELLLLNVPTQEEIQQLRQAENEHAAEDCVQWDAAEEFIFLLISIPHFKLRLQLWDFENTFCEHFKDIAERQRDILQGCECILTSRSVRRLLGFVLVAGNYLNGGTPRGRADGFAIDTLVQVRMVKMSQADHHGTLVDYLVQQMEVQYPCELEEIFAPGKDADRIKRAARSKLEEVSEEIRIFKAKAEGILHMVRASNKTREDAAFLQHGEVMAMCSAELEELQARQRRLNGKYAELCDYFHMDDSSTRKACDEFFGVWDQFMNDVARARIAIQAQEKEAETRRRRSLSLEQWRGQGRRPSEDCSRRPRSVSDRGGPIPVGGPRRSARRSLSAYMNGNGSGLIAGNPNAKAVKLPDLALVAATKAAREYLVDLGKFCTGLAATGPVQATAVLTARGYVAALVDSCNERIAREAYISDLFKRCIARADSACKRSC